MRGEAIETPTTLVVQFWDKGAGALPEASRAILAGMAGVPDFSLALNRLESDDLAKLRGRFAKMGVE